jgi:tetracycline 7-halogenase / FADH2 O2-dependent halogenase
MTGGHRSDVDVVVIGAGFSGALTALALRRMGRSVALIERGRHPRFAIGESSTPLANILIEELAATYDLPRVAPLSKWGTWRRAYPDLPVGLKRGFSFFHHTLDRPFADDEAHARQLLVGASPHDEIADTHWYRPAFDAFLTNEAQDAGVDLLDQTRIERIVVHGDTAQLDLARAGVSTSISACFVVDASGPRGALHRLLGLEETPTQWLPPTEGLYTHFEGVARWDEAVKAESGVPYPVDAAAVHQVFPGGWIWILRFNNGITSAGAAVTVPLARELRLEEGAPAWQRLLDRLPSVKAQFADARATLPFMHTPRVAFRSPVLCGQGWAMLPSAAGVIDPLLSTGFPLTLLGIGRLVDALESTWSGPGREAALDEYARQTQRELDATERLVAALYASMNDFDLFKRLTRLYFAAASFSETARRLGRAQLAPGFLLCDHPTFGPASRAIAEIAMRTPTGRARAVLVDRIDHTIEPFDLAGLGDDARRDWFPVLADDLIAGRQKLGATRAEIDSLLARCGFAASASHAIADCRLQIAD